MFEIWLQQSAPAMAVQIAFFGAVVILAIGLVTTKANRAARVFEHEEKMARMPLEHAEVELRTREQFITEREKNAASSKQIEGKVNRQ